MSENAVTFTSADVPVLEAAAKMLRGEQERVDNKTPLFKGADVGGVAGQCLIQYIERVERLEEEKAGIADDIKDIYSEAKSAGFEAKVMRQIVKLRKMDSQKRMEQQEILDLYMHAIGMA
jgi:uncharacterized protein (UPF0335 family)